MTTHLTAVQSELSKAGQHSSMGAEDWPDNGQLRQINVDCATVCHHSQQLSILTPGQTLNFILLHSQNAGRLLQVRHVMDLHPTRNELCHICLLVSFEASVQDFHKVHGFHCLPRAWFPLPCSWLFLFFVTLFPPALLYNLRLSPLGSFPPWRWR